MAFTARTPATAGTTSSASVEVNVPAGTTNGDVMFFWAGLQYTTLPSYSSGLEAWDQIATADPTGTSTRVYLFCRVANSEPASYTATFSSASGYKRCVIACYTSGDFNGADPVDVVSNTIYVTNNTTVRAAAMTVSANASPMVFFGNVYTSSGRTWTAPAAIGGVSWSEDYDNSDTTNRFTVGIYSMIVTNSGSTGNMDATISSSSTYKHGFAVALNPYTAPVSTISIPVLINHLKQLGAM